MTKEEFDENRMEFVGAKVRNTNLEIESVVVAYDYEERLLGVATSEKHTCECGNERDMADWWRCENCEIIK